MTEWDVIVLGGGAAGLFCAATAGYLGKKVLVLERSNKVGKKILMSGGGRCNFTNRDIRFDRYLSNNKHFCKSALSRYTQWDFIELVERYGIQYYEKTLGQLFCVDKANQIVNMLLNECSQAKNTIKLKQDIISVQKHQQLFEIKTKEQEYYAAHLIVATGGLSIPTLGGSAFGYQLADQFGHNILATKAGLVPVTYHIEDKERFTSLAGISIEAEVSLGNIKFNENILFTHRGLSGPAILQISSYWRPGQRLEIKLLPAIDLDAELTKAVKHQPEQQLKTFLSRYAAKRLLEIFIPKTLLERALKQLSCKEIQTIIDYLQNWSFLPNSTEGYRTAEVTLGGVDVNQVCSKTFESKLVQGLYFIGEVLDVTGWLGGYNFQWAWSSAYACGTALVK